MNKVKKYNIPPKADDSDSSIYQRESDDSEEMEDNEHTLDYQSLKSKKIQREDYTLTQEIWTIILTEILMIQIIIWIIMAQLIKRFPIIQFINWIKVIIISGYIIRWTLNNYYLEKVEAMTIFDQLIWLMNSIAKDLCYTLVYIRYQKYIDQLISISIFKELIKL